MDTYFLKMEFGGRKNLKLKEIKIIECIFEADSDEKAHKLAKRKWDSEDDIRRGSHTGKIKRKCTLYKKISW